MEYCRDPEEIYRRSFSIVKEEARLEELPQDMRPVAIRLIHSCGMVDVVEDLDFSANAVAVGREALGNGRPIFTDVEMVKSGIIERLLPAGNKVICTLNHAEVPQHATAIGNTRSAAAVDYWGEQLSGAVVVIGNAPTALFRLLERTAESTTMPALVVGMPVGFVGAVESKQALSAQANGYEYITVHGRRGGSAMAAAVINGICGGLS